jgi:cyanate permease
VHLAVIFVGAVGLIYWPTHLLLSWLFPAAAATAAK